MNYECDMHSVVRSLTRSITPDCARWGRVGQGRGNAPATDVHGNATGGGVGVGSAQAISCNGLQQVLVTN